MTTLAAVRTVKGMLSIGSLHDGKIERLRRTDALGQCTATELRQVARAGELVRVAAGDSIHPAGAPLHWCYLVVEGEAMAGERRMPAGSTYGDTEVLMRDRHGADALVAVTDVEVMAIPSRNFIELVETIPSLSAALSRSLAKRLAGAAAVTPNRGLRRLALS